MNSRRDARSLGWDKTRIRALWRRAARDRTAGVSVEWALVALPFLVLQLCMFELAFDFYAQEVLDMALQGSAREIAVGAIQQTATSIATFEQAAFCPKLAGLLPCASILVNVVPVSDFETDSPTTLPTTQGVLNPRGLSYCPGAPGQLMLAQAIYPAPSFLTLFMPPGPISYGAEPTRLIVASFGFVNEDYPVTGTTPAGC